MSSPTRRWAGRVLLVDAAGRVLLLRGCDPAEPARGTWWFTPGGGLESGETSREAAARELAEETGLQLAQEALGPVVHRRTASFRFAGTDFAQQEEFFLARVEAHEVVAAAHTPMEAASLLGHGWFAPDGLPVPVFPTDLAEVLHRALR